MRHSPGFALTAVLTLALGIGVNSGMLSFVNGLMLRPLYERPDEVVSVYSCATTPSGELRRLSYPNYLDLHEGTSGLFANLAAYFHCLRRAGRRCWRAAHARVGRDLQLLPDLWPAARSRTSVHRGRGSPWRECQGRDHQSRTLGAAWSRPGHDRHIRACERRAVHHLGVAVEGFTGTGIPGPEVWLPLGADDALGPEGEPAGGRLGSRDRHDLGIVGRLRPGTPVEAVAPALATVARRLEQAFPAVNGGYTLEMSAPWRLMFMSGPAGAAGAAALALMLMVMPAMVLLVACLNLADLLLARGQARRQELAIRSSLGGGRGRITRQLLTEGLILALAGGAAGLVLSTWGHQDAARPCVPCSRSP